MIDRYIHEFRPHLGDGHRGDWLFHGENGGHRSPAHASVSIAARVERETGLRVTAHQFRHAAAAMILIADPGNYEFARRVLGHRNIATTQKFYTSLEAFKATELFGSMMEEQVVNAIGRQLMTKKQKGAKRSATTSRRGS